MLSASHRDEVLEHLTSLVFILTQCRAPAAFCVLTRATLFVLAKKDDSSRPSAVGECLRRLVVKTLCSRYQDQARMLLWPLHIVVAHALGTEVGLRAARQWMRRNHSDPDAVFVRMDFKNAFDTRLVGCRGSGARSHSRPSALG